MLGSNTQPIVGGATTHHRYLGVGCVDEGELDAVADDDLAEEAGGAAVDVVAANDVIAGVEHGDKGGDGGHAAAEDVTGGSAFERGEDEAFGLRNPKAGFDERVDHERGIDGNQELFKAGVLKRGNGNGFAIAS